MPSTLTDPKVVLRFEELLQLGLTHFKPSRPPKYHLYNVTLHSPSVFRSLSFTFTQAGAPRPERPSEGGRVLRIVPGL